ncbi:MAG: YbjN domain-containing protein [Anaerolineae bacterium]|nr:YbjN domain-containing protein [Anaerolineae bacterium]
MAEENLVNQNALEAFTTLGDYLEEDGWFPQRMGDRFIYRMGFNGKNGRVDCFAQIRIELEQFLFYVVASVKVPDAQRAAVAEFLTRANYGLRIGNFEMDFSDGDVRYKSSLDFEGTELLPTLIKNAIYPAVQTMDRYLPGLMAVIYAGKSPEETIVEIEGDLS